MKKLTLLLITLTSFVYPALSAVEGAGDRPLRQAQGRPNFVYINIDDMGVMDVGFMGDTRYTTPNIDSLAGEGMIFTEGYAPASNCAPSRACVITGQWGARHGCYTVDKSTRGNHTYRKIIPVKNVKYIEKETNNLFEVFQGAGYLTASMGKWHVTPFPEKHGIDVNVGGTHRGSNSTFFSPYKNKALPDGPVGENLTDRLTDEAIKFLNENKDRKFFLYMPYFAVHTPLQGKKHLVAKYKKESPKLDANYAAMIETLDINIGRLMKTLYDLGLRKNTFVVFTSDNGGITKFSSQAPYRAGKGSYYEGGVREPFTISWPGHIKPGSRSDVPVTGIDFFPTFLEAAGITKPEGKILDGESLMPLLTQTGTIKERALYWHFPIYLQAYSDRDESRDSKFRTRPGSTMRLGKWKLHEYFEDGAFELYDLEADIGERKNLAETMPEKLEELKAMLYAWRADIDAAVPTEPNPTFDPKYEPKITPPEEL